ncbi:MAG: glycerol kinase GlpK [Candidatus Dormibacteraeota bacterium]|nr:glycerol kinase GlpK [Candidatus Dormibacteraeota bacterium]
MSGATLLAIDQGTSGTTALLVGADAEVRRRSHREVAVSYPRDGWVEQDAEALWESVCATVLDVLDGDEDLAAIGITNQRETLVVFDRRTLQPVAPAIVWQCRRSTDICDEHRLRGDDADLQARTGLLLDPYFTATKIEWLFRERPELGAAARRGELCAGTVDTWLIARMSAGRAVVTDASNASRTLLFDLRRGDFDDDLCERFGVPRAALPQVVDSAGQVAVTDPGAFLGRSLPICGVAGDQQAALFGQGCVAAGMSKNTYGTGSFLLTTVGNALPPPGEGVLETVAWRIGGRTTFALEGSIFVTGAALRWLRDGLGLLDTVEQAGPIFDATPDAAGCVFVPALTGLGAPWWDPAARGAIFGLSGGVRREHVVRAAIEAMAYQTRDVVEAMERASGTRVSELRVDGGASVMDGLCQFQADLLAAPVVRSASAEATALGAGMLAAVGAGIVDSPEAAASRWRAGRRFQPRNAARPDENYRKWLDCVRRVRSAPR